MYDLDADEFSLRVLALTERCADGRMTTEEFQQTVRDLLKRVRHEDIVKIWHLVAEAMKSRCMMN